MSNYIINDSELIAIADAIRSKNGTTDEYTTAEMPGAITAIVSGSDPTIESLEVTSNGTYEAPEGVDGYSPIVVNVPQDGAPPEKAFLLVNDCQYRFANDGWNWFIEQHGNQITTRAIYNIANMFQSSSTLTSIPFDINAKEGSNTQCASAFSSCYKLTTIGDLINFTPTSTDNLFRYCQRLRYLPNFVNWDWSYIQKQAWQSMNGMFGNCYSLREIPEEVTSNMWGIQSSTSYTPYYNGFSSCYALNKIRNLGVQQSTLTSNAFYCTFEYCHNLKELTFAMNEDGTPKTANWKAQTIDLTYYVGEAGNGVSVMTGYNSGITADKEVKDDATYQALKDDPDYFTLYRKYNKYNHDSAVNTINSLPDTSAYLATAGGTNTIKFRGAAGEATDGGAINTLTAEEIAVATAKGWTVSLV